MVLDILWKETRDCNPEFSALRAWDATANPQKPSGDLIGRQGRQKARHPFAHGTTLPIGCLVWHCSGLLMVLTRPDISGTDAPNDSHGLTSHRMDSWYISFRNIGLSSTWFFEYDTCFPSPQHSIRFIITQKLPIFLPESCNYFPLVTHQLKNLKTCQTAHISNSAGCKPWNGGNTSKRSPRRTHQRMTKRHRRFTTSSLLKFTNTRL